MKPLTNFILESSHNLENLKSGDNLYILIDDETKPVKLVINKIELDNKDKNYATISVSDNKYEIDEIYTYIGEDSDVETSYGLKTKNGKKVIFCLVAKDEESLQNMMNSKFSSKIEELRNKIHSKTEELNKLNDQLTELTKKIKLEKSDD